jgi:hypothetical protein
MDGEITMRTVKPNDVKEHTVRRNSKWAKVHAMLREGLSRETAVEFTCPDAKMREVLRNVITSWLNYNREGLVPEGYRVKTTTNDEGGFFLYVSLIEDIYCEER